MNTRKMTSLPGVTVFTVPDGNYDNNAVLPKNLIIIHTEVGFKKGTEARFTDPQSHVSAQYGVNQDGSYDEYVDEDQVAYHAGNYAVNQRSIGIEHEDLGQPNSPRPDILYQKSAALVRDICQFWNIPIDRDHIKKHSEVSDAPTGCPDALDIDRIVREANNPATSGNDLATLQAQLDQKNKDYDNLYNQDQNNLHTISQQKDVIDNLNQQINDRNNNITQLNATVQTKETEIQARDQELSIVKPIASQIPDLKNQLAQAENDRKLALDAQESQNKIIAQLKVGKPKGFINKLLYLFT